jgi:DNA-binding NarL/FixJ family response regulator
MSSGSSTPTGARRLLVATRDGTAVDVLRRTLGPMRFEMLAAHSGSCAIELAARYRPDVAVADIELGGPTTDLRFARTLKERGGASIILVTDRLDAQTVAAIAAFGRCGVLRKPIDPRQLELTLLLAVERRARAGAGLAHAEPPAVAGPSSAMLEDVLRRIAAEIQRVGLTTSPDSADPPLLSTLRPREQQVVRLLLRHYRVPAIARELSISPQTVRNHLKHVFKSAGVHSQQELLERIT